MTAPPVPHASATSSTPPDERHYVLLGPRQLGERACFRPPLPADWVRVRIAYCGVCGSDVSRWAGQRAADYPVSLGHEWVGVIEQLGVEVSGLKPGDVVTTDLNHRCGTCDPCLRDRSHLCRHGRVGRFSNRGFATVVHIHAGYLQTCQQPVGPHLALAEPLSCALHAIDQCQPAPEDTPLVIGAGGLGMCAAFAMQALGQVDRFDVTDRSSTRLQRLADALGPAGRVVLRPVGSYEVVLDTSGTTDGLRQACELVSPGGRLCTVSHLPDDADVRFLVDRLVNKDVTLTMSYLNGPAVTLRHAVRLLEQSWSPRCQALLDVRPLTELPPVFEQRGTSPVNKVVIAVGGAP